MKTVLSIDFDYFIDTDINTRNLNFPDGVDDKDPKELEREWDYFYKEFPQITNIGVIPQYYLVKDALSNHNFGKVFVEDSHKHIWDKVLKEDDDFVVLHLDFHHDNYISGGTEIDCANWVRHLMEHKPNTKLLWLRREDSDTTSLFGEFPYKHLVLKDNLVDFYFNDYFDYVFVCFSPEWTPPHLRGEYNEFFESIEKV